MESWQSRYSGVKNSINLNELVNDIEKQQKETKKPVLHKFQKGGRRMLLTIAAFILASLILFAGGIYLTMSEQIDEEEIKAAEGVADVALALTYAKLNRETPQKMDWSDPNFLNRMLLSVVSNQYPIATTIGSTGQFRDFPS